MLARVSVRLGMIALLLPALLFAQQPIPWATLDDILFRASIASQADVELIVLHQDEIVYRHRTKGFGS
ncbi:MAG: hypothetical protein KIT83_10155, partial [Bryobacterales bacterium]|nr:hypothetical protein [Bryobacterales bacterium]